MTDSVRTSLTLIGRLAQDQPDHAAWEEFTQRYGAILRSWCRRYGLQDADVEDVVQNVLLELTRYIRDYQPRPTSRFRSWLRTITQRAWYDFSMRRKKLDRSSGGSAVMQLLNSVEAREDLTKQHNEELSREFLKEAMNRVEPRVKPTTWQAFSLMTFDGLSGDQIAEQLGIKSGTVFVACCRVRKMIEDEYRLLDPPEGEDP